MRRPGWAKGGVRIRVRSFFEPRDLWRGMYWNYEADPEEDEDGYFYPYTQNSHARLTIWICPIPMCVLRIDLVAK